MPESRKERNPSSVSISSVNIAPYTGGTLIDDFVNLTAGTHNIPAGFFAVEVFNSGVIDITANGKTIKPGDTYPFRAFSDPVNQILYRTQAIEVIIPVNGSARYWFNTSS